MTKVTRFFATCLLVVSLTVVALADGGETHGPGFVPPQPLTTECTTDCTGNEASSLVSEPSFGASDVANVLVAWLVQSAL